MCLGVPGNIVSIQGNLADVNFGGVTRKVSLMLCPDVKVGDYVLVHVGFAIQRLDKEDAVETLRLFEEFDKGQHGAT